MYLFKTAPELKCIHMFTFIYAYLGSLTFYALESKSQAEACKQNNQHLLLPLGSCSLHH